MALRYLRVVVGLLLGTSGALMYAASWQRWAGACRADQFAKSCLLREDHLYDFTPPLPRWEPVGDAAQLAGASMLILAVVFVLLPWALTGRRPGPVGAVALLVAVLAQTAVGVGTLLSGLAGRVVEPIFVSVTLNAWMFVPFGVLIWFVVAARGWTLAAMLGLILADPFMSVLTTYRFGAYDSRPWYEAISGSFTMVAGVCMLAAAVFGSRDPAPESHDTQDSSTGDGSTGTSPGPAVAAPGRS